MVETFSPCSLISHAIVYVNRVCNNNVIKVSLFHRGRVTNVQLNSSLNKRYYSSLSKENNLNCLNPNFVSGFTDGEGSFIVIISANPGNRTGLKVTAGFRIGLHEKDLTLLKSIQSYFGGVGIFVKEGDKMSYRVTSLKHITEIIIPHFDKYPLMTQKRES